MKLKDFFIRYFSVLKSEKFYIFYTFSFFLVYFLIVFMTMDKTYSLDDHFFHIKFAELMRTDGLSAFTNFDSIYFSNMGIGDKYFVYYNFLFYIALIPFTFFLPLVLGLKLYAVFILASSFTAVYFFVKKIGMKYSFFWVNVFMMALVYSGWMGRFTLARPFVLAPVLLVIILYNIHNKKYFLNVLVSFFYFYWHTATFIFPFCLSLGYATFEAFYGKKVDWKNVISNLVGTLSAVLSAYLFFPGIIPYLRDVIFPVFFDTAIVKNSGILEGNEVYGKNILDSISMFFIFFSALCMCGCYDIMKYIQEKKNPLEVNGGDNSVKKPLKLTLFVASLIFLLASNLSARFIDYFVFFCFLYFAVFFSSKIKFFEVNNVLFKKSLKISFSILFIYMLVNLSFKFYDNVASQNSYTIAQGAAQWLGENVKKDAIIFNVDWDSFPLLYYFNGNEFRYVTGLEPRFLYDFNKELYWKWFNIGGGIFCSSRDCGELVDNRGKALKNESLKGEWLDKEGESIAKVIKSDFHSDIIVVSNGRKDLLKVLDNSDYFKREYFDDENSSLAVYRIVK